MIDLLTPERTTEARSSDPEASRYVKSYLVMRLFVGALGFLLPLMLVFGDGWGFDGSPFPRNSLSAYYYSGVRELFVGTLCATGVFLATYKVADKTLDNTLSWVAGVAAAVVALCPTGRADHDLEFDEMPLQTAWGEHTVETIHFVAAAIFIVSLGVITYFFGVREGGRPQRPDTKSPRFWRNFHYACAGAIGLALLWIVVTMWVIDDGPRWALLAGEWAAVWAFAASWFAKGAEFDALKGEPKPTLADPGPA